MRKMMVILFLVLPLMSAKLLSKIYKPEQLVVFGQGKLSNLIMRKIKFYLRLEGEFAISGIHQRRSWKGNRERKRKLEIQDPTESRLFGLDGMVQQIVSRVQLFILTFLNDRNKIQIIEPYKSHFQSHRRQYPMWMRTTHVGYCSSTVQQITCKFNSKFKVWKPYWPIEIKGC